MTLKELQQRQRDRVYVGMQIERIRRKINELEERATQITTTFGQGGGRSGTPSDRVGSAVAEIDRYKHMLIDYEGRLLRMQQEEECNILNTIDDAYVRAALQLKYVDGMTWQQVANRFGGTTGEALKMMCKRFLKNM